MKLTKVYFYWVCRDTNAFEWFADLLHSLEEQTIRAGKDNLIEYHIHLTGSLDERQTIHIIMNEDQERDVITNLRQKTYFGRPKWEEEFRKVASAHSGTRIGVFFCGPKGLSKELHKLSNRFSDTSTGTHFVYNKENF